MSTHLPPKPGGGAPNPLPPGGGWKPGGGPPKPAGGPPLPPNGGGGAPPGNPKPPGGAGPPIPIAGPPRPTGRPLPAGLLMPAPACNVATPAPGTLVPNLADGSDGGGPSTDADTILVPRKMMRPSVRFSSTSVAAAAEPGAAGAVDFACRLLTLRNSSVSVRTRFMC